VTGGRPLPNRVDPFGELRAVAARGALMGNRGGRFHRDDRTLGARRWTNTHWIACVCEFKGRKRDVWGRFYTELFFLDEPTALAAGHRPCFECRRTDATRFRDALGEGRLNVEEIDARLHAERLEGRAKRLHRMRIESLPDGAFIAIEGLPFAVRGDALWPWSYSGYGAPLPRPRSGEIRALTPPTVLRALAAGYAAAL